MTARIAILIDRGAVTPTELLVAMSAMDRDYLILTVPGPRAELVRSLWDEVVPVVEVSGSVAEDAEQLRRHGATGCLTFDEAHLAYANDVAQVLGGPHQQPTSMALLTNKVLQRRAFRIAGLPAPNSHDIAVPFDAAKVPELRRALEELSGPFVIKPARGAGSRETHLATTRDQVIEKLADIAARAAEAGTGEVFCIEEYVPDQVMRSEPAGCPSAGYVSVETVRSRGRVVMHEVTGKFPQLPPFRETGQFYPSGLDDDARSAAQQAAGDALAALGAGDGIFHTEVKLSPGSPVVIEVNGRLGGNVGQLYSDANGYSLIEQACRIAADESCETFTARGESVTYQHFTQAPLDALELVEVSGARRLREAPRHISYVQQIPAGTTLSAEVGSRDIDCLTARALSHHDLIDDLHRRMSALTYTFRRSDGAAIVPGPELLSC